MGAALLAGTSVLDLSRLLPGPLATWHLAALGARVVKIEPAATGDYAGRIGPMDGEVSYFYRHLNAGKDIVPLDVTRSEGRLALLERVSKSDLMVESFRPGVLDRLGIGFERLREANPRLCLISISGYGSRGELAAAAGHDINYLVPGRDLLSGGVPCYGLYRTRDARYLAVGALEAKFWERFCEALGRMDLASRHWQNGQEIGSEEARAVREELTRIFAAEPLTYWQQVFAGSDCCVTPVLRMDEVLSHPVCAPYWDGGTLRSAVRLLA